MKQRRKVTDPFQHAGEGQLEREAPLAARMRPYVPPLFQRGEGGIEKYLRINNPPESPFSKGGLFSPPVNCGEHWG